MRCNVLLAVVLAVLPGAAQDTVFHDPLGEAAKLVTTRLVAMAESRQGVVGHVDTSATPIRLYIKIDDVVPGQILSVQAIGKPILIDGKEVGREESPAGLAEVERRQNDKLVICKLVKPEPNVTPKVGDAAYLKPVPDSLAVTAFTRPDGSGTPLGLEMGERLEQALGASGRFTVVERTRFDALLAEHQLGVSDLFDTAKTARFGQMLQAKGVVLGTIALGDAAFTINVKVVDITSGVQTASARVDVGATEELRRKYGAQSGSGRVAPAPTTVQAEGGAGGFRSAASTELGARQNLDFIRRAAERDQEEVSANEQAVTWTFGSKHRAFVYDDGVIVIASAQPLDNVGVLNQLDADLATAINVVASVTPNVTDADKLSRRFRASRYYADQPGMLHRIYFGFDEHQQTPEVQNWVLSVPDCKAVGGRTVGFTGGGMWWGDDASIRLRDQLLLGPKLGTTLELKPFEPAVITYGQHAMTITHQWSRSAFFEMDVITEPTAGRFSLTGALADRAHIWVNGLVSELFNQ